MRFLYPNGLKKALTFSYDDGQDYDKKLAEILRSHGLKGTFHLNSGKLGQRGENEEFVSAEECAEVYAGHEIACHGVVHRSLPGIATHQMVEEILEDRKALEKLTGGMVQGMSYAYGNYNEKVIEVASSVGIRYSRTVQDTKKFYPPDDFMQWHPTCHHNNHLLELGERFLNVSSHYELPLMYVWGHSFEFGRANDWSVIEKFAEMMSGKDDIWYATNMDIYTYIQATRCQEFSADGLTIYNPTATSVWLSTENSVLEVKPGETKYVGEL